MNCEHEFLNIEDQEERGFSTFLICRCTTCGTTIEVEDN
jgi:hypothetical protein